MWNNIMPDSLSRYLDLDDGEYDPISCVLAHANKSSRPGVRVFFNYIASKISSRSEREISRLTDDKIARLIKTELSRLSEAEKNHLVNTELSNLIAIAHSIVCLLATCKDEEITYLLSNGATKIVNAFFDLPIVIKFFDDLFIFGVFTFGACFVGLLFITLLGKVLHTGLSSSNSANFTVTTTNAAQERLISSNRSIFLSKYSRTLDLKGLKGIGEIYSQELLMGLRQEVEPYQEGTSRAVVSSSRPTGLQLRHGD